MIGYNSTSVSDISQLSQINSITGDLNISWTHLQSLKGLQHIKHLHNLLIEGNYLLTDLAGLDSLTYVSGFLYIEVNPQLQNLNGLENLGSVSSDLKFDEGLFGGTTPSNQNLAEINLPSLKKVGGELNLGNIRAVKLFDLPQLDSVIGNLRVSNGNQLNDFSGFNSLKYIGEDLSILQSAITSFNGFNNLTKVGGAVTISKNSNIANLHGFDSLTEIGNYLMGTWNDNLSSLSGIEHLQNVSLLDFEFNQKLTDFCPIKPLMLRMMTLYPNDSPYDLFRFNYGPDYYTTSFTYKNVLDNCP